MCKTGAAIDNNGSNTHFEFNIGGVLEKVKKNDQTLFDYHNSEIKREAKK